MGRRLAGWRSLGWRERLQFIACTTGLGATHASLALLGYGRTRRVVEALTRRRTTRVANEAEVQHAKHLARLAATAGREGAIEATCLRQALLMHGWLRARGFNPVFHLGVKTTQDPGKAFEAHAWVELEGTPLLTLDLGHRSFFTSTDPT